jgi:hypothetical protein
VLYALQVKGMLYALLTHNLEHERTNMSKKNQTVDPEAPEGNSPSVSEPETAGNVFSVLNTDKSVLHEELFNVDGTPKTLSYGQLAAIAVKAGKSHLRNIVDIGRVMNHLHATRNDSIRKIAKKMEAKQGLLKANTLQQYAGMATIADEIGREFFDLGTFRNAQQVKGLLGKLEDKQAQKEAIRLFVGGSDLKTIRNRFGLAKAKGIVASDADAAQVASDNGLDRDKFLSDLGTLRQLKLTKAGFQALAKKMVADGTADTFLAILEEVREARDLAASAE